MIGYIFGNRGLKRMVKGNKKLENIDFYLELAREKKINLCLYSIPRIKTKTGMVKGYVYDYKKQILSQKVVPLPKVTMSRTIHKRKSVRKVREVERKHGVTFVNIASKRQRNKYRIYEHLHQAQKVRDSLPDTARLYLPNLQQFLTRYHKVAIKPTIGSLGKNIYVLEEQGEHYAVKYIKGKSLFQYAIQKHELETFIRTKFPNPRRFHVQQWINILTYKGRKFDIRATVQKGADEKWVVTRMEVRLAEKKKKIVTNIAQGGQEMSINQILDILPKRMKENLERLSIDVASEMEQLHPGTIDLGLDIAIDQNYKLWFIEANFRAQRGEFGDDDDGVHHLDAYYRTPFEYIHGKAQET